uniref:Uncharacterized protein n=1 Tax=Cacopsylla melanoneura TaxID=428564 RepID=A0A8D9AIC3_9HEMI
MFPCILLLKVVLVKSGQCHSQGNLQMIRPTVRWILPSSLTLQFVSGTNPVVIILIVLYQVQVQVKATRLLLIASHQLDEALRDLQLKITCHSNLKCPKTTPFLRTPSPAVATL